MTVVQEVHCNTVAELVEHLSPHAPAADFRHWRVSGRWIFRGVKDAERHELTPSALRLRTPWDKLAERAVRWPAVTADSRIEPVRAATKVMGIEKAFLRHFLERADRAGLRIPEDTQTSRASLDVDDWILDHLDGKWPPPELLSHLALAQHYGVPTRVLDWTYEAPIAMFFASQRMPDDDAPPKDPPAPPTYLAVWALNVDAIEALWGWLTEDAPRGDATFSDVSPDVAGALNFVLRANAKPPEKKYRDVYRLNESDPQPRPYASDFPRVQIVTAPYEAIPNLAAQRGLFTLDRSLTTLPLDKAIAERAAFVEQHAPVRYRQPLPGPAMIKFVLPRAKEATSLRKRLAREGVSKATLMPGYAGVVASIEDDDDPRFPGRPYKS